MDCMYSPWGCNKVLLQLSSHVREPGPAQEEKGLHHPPMCSHSPLEKLSSQVNKVSVRRKQLKQFL